jgi:hypothetical protein
MPISNHNELQILGAAYGLQRVTSKVISLVDRQTTPQSLRVQASNGVFGDGWPGIAKTLVIAYRYGDDGTPHVATVTENNTITINSAGAATGPRPQAIAPELTVWGAVYGPADVTAKVRTLVATDQSLSLIANNATFGDSWPGYTKSFVIVASYTGQTPFVDIVEENSAYRLKYRPPLQILSGFYGLKDVTTILQTNVSRRTLQIAASNAVFGDGWPGVTKILTAVYQYGNGVPRVATAQESSTLGIDFDGVQSVYSPPVDPIALNIVGANYGPADVTAKVKALISSQSLNFQAGNPVFGDPWSGVKKSFSMVYGWGGSPLNRLVVAENGPVAISYPADDQKNYDSFAGFLANGDLIRIQAASGNYWAVASDGTVAASATSDQAATQFTVAGVMSSRPGMNLRTLDGRLLTVRNDGRLLMANTTAQQAALIVSSLDSSGSFILGVSGFAGAPYIAADGAGNLSCGTNYGGDFSSSFILSFQPTALGSQNHIQTHAAIEAADIDPKLRAVIWDLTFGWLTAVGLTGVLTNSQPAQDAVAALIRNNPRTYAAVTQIVAAVEGNPQASIFAAIFGFGGTLLSTGTLLPVLRILWDDLGGKWWAMGWFIRKVLVWTLLPETEVAAVAANFAVWAYKTTTDVLAYVQSGAPANRQAA